MARAEITETVTQVGPSGYQRVITGAAVAVYDRGTTDLVPVYAEQTGDTEVDNPILTVNGRIEGWLEEGSYDLAVTHGAVEYTQAYEAGAAGSGGGGGGSSEDASTTTKGVTKLSVAPVAPSQPIAAGTNDPRLSDARTPSSHAASHKSGGGDAIRLDELAAPTAPVDLNTHRLTGLAQPSSASDAVRHDDARLSDGRVDSAARSAAAAAQATADAAQPAATAATDVELAANATADRARANHTGTQTSATISDFTEAVQDAVGAALASGTGATVTYDDTANTITISAAGTSDLEAIRDAIGVALVGVGNIAVAVDDAGNTITISTAATVNATDAALRDRATHTGTQSADTVTDGSTNKAYSAVEKTKLAGVAPAATANDTDGNLKARANHTGVQAPSTISGGGGSTGDVLTKQGDGTYAPAALPAESASAVTFTPTGTIAATDVQAAVAEVASEAVPKAGGTMTGELVLPDLSVGGLTGATAGARIVGATAGGAPASGTFLIGDCVVDRVNACIWVCTTAGSPGTWAVSGLDPELAYSELTTNPANITSTTVTDIGLSITLTAPTRPVMVHFYAPRIREDTADKTIILSLIEGASTVRSKLWHTSSTANANDGVNIWRRFASLTPGSSYTFKMAWSLFASGGNGIMNASADDPGPVFLRATRT